MATCASRFCGIQSKLGKVLLVKKHLTGKRSADVFVGLDMDGRRYAWLDLPTAKAVAIMIRETQIVFIIVFVPHGPLRL